MIKDWKRTFVKPGTSILEALKVIDKEGLQIALVVDADGKLLGTITDGDVRRGILRGVNLGSPVEEVMFKTPRVAYLSESREVILQKMASLSIHHIPVLDDEGRIVNVEFIEDLIKENRFENEVMLMAGGLGTRLRPLTDNFPKPMLNVGGKPILETIITNFIDYGYYKFHISVNYLAHTIEDYFGDGSKWGAQISYIHEKDRLGTAGSLSLLDKKPDQPFFVMNADLLTKVNFEQLMAYHNAKNSAASMCVRQYEYQVPYGVVNINDHKLVSIEEKPVNQFLISAGIYVLNPETLDFIPKNNYFDMPALLQKLTAENKEVSVFPIREYWMDIGQMNDFHQANNEFSGIFG